MFDNNPLDEAHTFVLLISTLLSTLPIYANYLTNCSNLVHFYKNIKRVKFVRSFYTDVKKDEDDTYMNEFVQRFNSLVLLLHIQAKRKNLFISASPLRFNPETKCIGCTAPLSKTTDYESALHCNTCGLITRVQGAIAYADVSRVHAFPVYLYDRKVQFKELLLQFQGKNKHTDLSILNKLVIPPTRMSKLDFLQMLKTVCKNRTHLDSVHGLYYHVYKIKPPDLSSIENCILNDFDKFLVKYQPVGKMHVSNNFLLYQFLNKYKFNVTKDDVLYIDTVDIINDHTLNAVFTECGWTCVQ